MGKASAIEHDVDLQLISCTTHEIPNVGLGDLSEFTDAQVDVLHELQSTSQRKKWAKEDKALPGGEYPIPNVSYLKKAIQAFGRAKNKSKVKRWIIRRARGLKRTDLLPESWGVVKGKKTAKTAAATTQHDGVMVAVYPPPEVATTLAGETDGDETSDELHVTLAYLGRRDELSDDQLELIRRTVADVAISRRPLEANVNGIGTFTSPEADDPRWYAVDAVGLNDLRTEVVRAFEDVGVEPRVEHDFTPHMTVRYGGDELTGIPEGGDATWPVEALVFVAGDARDVYALGHHPVTFDDGTTCELCGNDESDARHDLDDVPQWFDTLADAQLTIDESDTEFVESPGPCSLNRSPKYNWVEKQGGLPNYMCQVSRGIARGARSLDSAIPIAIGKVKDWARGGENVSAGVRTRAAAAVAEWEKMRAAAKADNASVVLEEFATDELREFIGPAVVRPSVVDLEEPIDFDEQDDGWAEGYEYFWDPDTDAIYRIDVDGVVETFAPNDPEDPDDTAPVWRQDGRTPEEIQSLPTVDDPETLDALIGAATDPERTTKDAVPDDAGRRFHIPVVIPEGVSSGDRRTFAKDSLEYKEPPIPVLWQRETDEGHKGSVTVAKINGIERLDGGLGNAYGVFDTHEDAIEAARQVKEKFLTGVSGDVDQFKAELSEDEEGSEAVEIQHGRLVAVTLVAKPAFQEATIELTAERGETEVLAASAGPLHPPRDWFDDPQLNDPTRLTVGDDGRVFGHIATWGTSHLGNPSIKPPRSSSGYRQFNAKPLRTANGTDVNVGQLTLVGGHADLSYDAKRTMAHYDDTKSAVADVRAGEDAHGIWVAGATRPTISDEQVRAFRASDPSGDWRTVDGHLELVAVCQVNTPGFPVARSLVADGEQVALVAAGTIELVHGERLSLEARVASLEAKQTAYEEHVQLEKEMEFRQAIESLRE